MATEDRCPHPMSQRCTPTIHAGIVRGTRACPHGSRRKLMPARPSARIASSQSPVHKNALAGHIRVMKSKPCDDVRDFGDLAHTLQPTVLDVLVEQVARKRLRDAILHDAG